MLHSNVRTVRIVDRDTKVSLRQGEIINTMRKMTISVTQSNRPLFEDLVLTLSSVFRDTVVQWSGYGS